MPGLNHPPIDPVDFRTACMELLEIAAERKEQGEGFDLFTGGPLFFMDYYDIENGGDEAQEQSMNASMRLYALLSALKLKEDELSELTRPAEEGVKELHLALFEAAAVAPLKEGHFDVEDLLAEARPRVADIDRLNTLFGEEE